MAFNLDSNAKLSFPCRQAHGSDVRLVTGFSNLKELYQKLSDLYDFSVDDILFCTRNTHRIIMKNVIEAELYFDDFIFVHRKGLKKQIVLTKSERVLGLTIMDNGNGCAFIKDILQGSNAIQYRDIQVGDHIEGIDNKNFVGLGHIEVVNYLKNIPVGNSFVLNLVEPLKSPNGASKSPIGRINELLYSFMGCVDSDLATKLYDMAMETNSANGLVAAVDSCELEYFGFADSFLIELWGIVRDAKAERIIK